jgi:integrase
MIRPHQIDRLDAAQYARDQRQGFVAAHGLCIARHVGGAVRAHDIAAIGRGLGGDPSGLAGETETRVRDVEIEAVAAGIHAPIGNHSFRATGITACLASGGALEHGQEMAAHESPRTTKPYDRTQERLTQDEVERIRC